MSNAMQSFFYGLSSIVFAAAIIALCSGVKAAMKKLLSPSTPIATRFLLAFLLNSYLIPSTAI